MRRWDVAFAFALLAAFAWAAYEARDWPDEARVFPLAVALPGAALALAQLALSALGRDVTAAEAEADAEVFGAERVRRTVEILGWIVGLLLAVYLVGFVVAVPLVAFAYLRTSGREGWVASVVVAALCWALLYGVFDRALHVPLPTVALLRALGLG